MSLPPETQVRVMQDQAYQTLKEMCYLTEYVKSLELERDELYSLEPQLQKVKMLLRRALAQNESLESQKESCLSQIKVFQRKLRQRETTQCIGSGKLEHIEGEFKKLCLEVEIKSSKIQGLRGLLLSKDQLVLQKQKELDFTKMRVQSLRRRQESTQELREQSTRLLGQIHNMERQLATLDMENQTLRNTLRQIKFDNQSYAFADHQHSEGHDELSSYLEILREITRARQTQADKKETGQEIQIKELLAKVKLLSDASQAYQQAIRTLEAQVIFQQDVNSKLQAQIKILQCQRDAYEKLVDKGKLVMIEQNFDQLHRRFALLVEEGQAKLSSLTSRKTRVKNPPCLAEVNQLKLNILRAARLISSLKQEIDKLLSQRAPESVNVRCTRCYLRMNPNETDYLKCECGLPTHVGCYSNELTKCQKCEPKVQTLREFRKYCRGRQRLQ